KLKLEDAEKRVEKVAAEHGWAHGAMPELRDQYEMNQDAKVLGPLKEAYVRNPQYSRDVKGNAFAQTLFFRPGDPWNKFTARELNASLAPGFTGEKKRVLYWKTEDKAAEPLSFAQAKPKVEQAWRMEKARALAKTKAEELAKQARDTHGDYAPVLNEASKHF